MSEPSPSDETRSVPRCQSCAMPLGAAGYYGTNADGSENREYCRYCWKNGRYVEPDLTLEAMIDKSIGFMTTSFGMPREKAEELSRKYIPPLKRWKSS